ncbi:MAG: hypothetical protein EAZ67_13175 [Cytophagales bacterium]|nr:MAG: hypothetical protein EAY72_09770 [Bacteroidota bacterium]TAE68321.1 MAG: hypothetical protein EAY68_04660 [Bacteroidota bacterium]TAF31227.1 MAG: hypothetical protein EAZ67_13175 [Cytophagales bacterium]
MLVRKLALLTLFIGSYFTSVHAQRFDSVLQKMYDVYPIEKVHLHFDKLMYSPGETIWYKGYVTANNLPTDVSKTLYVDFLDDAGKLLFHRTGPLAVGGSGGQFEIPLEYKGASITVNAYTSWMMNFDTAFIFQKTINIIPPQESMRASKLAKQASQKEQADKLAQVMAAPTNIQLQFLPEGGQWVNGLQGKMAFIAYDAFAKPFAVSGIIKTNTGTVVDSFKAKHNGMGVFTVTPQAGTTYTAYWKDERGKEQQTALPAAVNNGVNLAVTGTNERRNFLITRTDDAPESQRKMVLMAYMNQQLVYRAKIDLTKQSTLGGSIPVSELPTGVLQITLFDANWAPLLERVTFVNNNNYSIDVQAQLVVKNLTKRGKNLLEIKMYDTIGAHLSVAVTDADIPYENANTIYSQLLLAADVRGKVFNPTYYFDNTSEEAKDYLDFVMLTHGFRKYNWQALANNIYPNIQFKKDSAYLSVNGIIRGVSDYEYRLAENITIILQAKDSSKQFLILPIQKNGTFQDSKMLFFDTVNVFYQFNKNTSLASRANIVIGNGLLPWPEKLYSYQSKATLLDTSGMAKQRFWADEQRRLLKLIEGTTLEGVIVKSKPKSAIETLDKKYASGLFAGDAQAFDLTNPRDARALGAQNILQYLQGMVAGLQITGAGNMGGTGASATWRGSQVQFFLDQTPTQIELIMNLPVTDIAYVKVFRPPFFGGSGGGAGGAIAIYTKRGGGDAGSVPSKLSKVRLAGYSPIKEFFSPDYSQKQEEEVSDVRSTLYWNPYIKLDAKNKRITVPIYNNDFSKRVRIVVEGMNEDGQLFRFDKIVQPGDN